MKGKNTYHQLKEFIMRGSIRSLIGFMIVFGVVGGLDTDSIQLWQAIPLAAVGLSIMAWGASSMKQKYN